MRAPANTLTAKPGDGPRGGRAAAARCDAAQRARRPRTVTFLLAVAAAFLTAPFSFPTTRFDLPRAGVEGRAGRSRTARGAGARVETGGRVTAPSDADDTSAAYLAKTPSV